MYVPLAQTLENGTSATLYFLVGALVLVKRPSTVVIFFLFRKMK